jgi:hypothetical protein
MKKSCTITYKGEELEIEGTYHKGFSGDRDTPPDSPSFEIETVKYKGVDVTSLIDAIKDEVYGEFEKLCFEEFDNQIDEYYEN